MCGIIGYIGKREAAPIVLEGLKRLEYRGYDSVGMATVFEKAIHVKKDAGKVEEVSKRYNLASLPGRIGIGHTRWATHGKVSKENAHPHLSNSGEIAVVHNGIIENYLELKEFLKLNGFSFKSETDTEVIPNLIEYYMKNGFDFENAVIASLQKLKGSFALLVINKNFEEIVAVKKESPLVLGISDHGMFAASDIPAFLKYTKKVIYLKDGDVAFISPQSIRIYNFISRKNEKRKIYEVDYTLESIEKRGFRHYMLKEILEQVEIIKRFEKSDHKELKKVSEVIKNANHIWFVAAGTSYHASLVGKYFLSQITGINSTPILASEFEWSLPVIKEGDVIFAISQSGETADVLQAVKKAKEKNVKVISLVNVPGSSLTRLSDCVIPINAGIEIGVAATKTYTAEVLNLAYLAHVIKGTEKEIKKELRYVWNVIYNLTAETTKKIIERLAEVLKNKEHIFLIGRGLEYATAREAALKIKEISYIHAEAFAGGELKHGTIALIEKETPVISFISEKTKDEILSNVEEVKSRGAFVIGVSSENNKNFDFWIKTPENGILNPIIQIIPMQLLAYQLAIVRGFDPDKPRNLAKSVTVV